MISIFKYTIYKCLPGPPPPPSHPPPLPGAPQSFHLLSKIEWIVGRRRCGEGGICYPLHEPPPSLPPPPHHTVVKGGEGEGGFKKRVEGVIKIPPVGVGPPLQRRKLSIYIYVYIYNESKSFSFLIFKKKIKMKRVGPFLFWIFKKKSKWKGGGASPT
nr:hypothetical protein [Morchella crassipes]